MHAFDMAATFAPRLPFQTLKSLYAVAYGTGLLLSGCLPFRAANMSDVDKKLLERICGLAKDAADEFVCETVRCTEWWAT